LLKENVVDNRNLREIQIRNITWFTSHCCQRDGRSRHQLLHFEYLDKTCNIWQRLYYSTHHDAKHRGLSVIQAVVAFV